MVEVPARVDARMVQPHARAPFDAHQLGLVSSVRAVEEATLRHLWTNPPLNESAPPPRPT